MITLPTLSAEVAAHSDHLRQFICQEIDDNGPLTLARYMELALYQPGLGYYRCGAQKFGVSGDFITAPELSPLFAGCLAQHSAQLLAEGYQDIFEMGAGSGVLAIELMRALELQRQLPEHYYILELSSELQQRQQALVRNALPHLYERFVWLTQWPQGLNAIVIANELFDAMPVHRFVIQNGLREYYITHQAGELQWHIDMPSTPALANQLDSYVIDFAEGYSSEINLQLPAWMASLCASLKKAHMLFVDYGYKREVYYHPDRSMGTLMCHLQHRAHENPLLYPGAQDITTHVDFTLAAESAVAQGCEVIGLQTQADYLIQHGVMDLLASETDMQRQILLAQQAKQLLMPGQMGEAFKVLQLAYAAS